MNGGVALGLGWCALAGGFSAVTLARLLGRRRPPAPATRVPVLLVRPLDRPTPREVANLAAPLDYPGPLEHVVLSPERPPLPGGVRWEPSDPSTPNRKVGHVLHALRVLPREGRVVLVVDADVAVTGALVAGLAAPVAAGAALSTAVPTPLDVPGAVSGGASGLSARAVAALLRRTHHSFRALHVMSAGAPAVCGKALGLGARALEELPPLADHIGEDLELSKRLHARGLGVALCEVPAVVPQAPGGWEAALARFTRWMQVLGHHRPGLYPTVPLLFTPTWPLLGLGAWTGSPLVLAGVAALGAVRTALSWRLAALSAPPALTQEGGEEGDDGSRAADWLLGEALLLAAFLCSLVRPPRVSWRGRVYALQPGGRMSPVWTEVNQGEGA